MNRVFQYKIIDVTSDAWKRGTFLLLEEVHDQQRVRVIVSNAMGLHATIGDLVDAEERIEDCDSIVARPS